MRWVTETRRGSTLGSIGARTADEAFAALEREIATASKPIHDGGGKPLYDAGPVTWARVVEIDDSRAPAMERAESQGRYSLNAPGYDRANARIILAWSRGESRSADPGPIPWNDPIFA